MNAQINALIQRDNYTTELTANEHGIIVDEPISIGGRNKGMTPTDMLAGSLASCTAITLKMYLDQKQIETHFIDVHTELISQEGAKPKFIRQINIKADIPEDMHKRILSVANKCPVHKLIHDSFEIETELL